MFKCLHEENDAGSSVAGLWHSSSVGAVCPTGHNSDSSQARFDGGAHYFGDVELVEPLEGVGPWRGVGLQPWRQAYLPVE